MSKTISNTISNTISKTISNTLSKCYSNATEVLICFYSRYSKDGSIEGQGQDASFSKRQLILVKSPKRFDHNEHAEQPQTV